MQIQAMIESCAQLLQQVFRFDHPADAVVARFVREHRSLGPRERAVMGDTVFAVLRERLKWEHLARSGPGSRWWRLAVLGFAGDRDRLKAALTTDEQAWLAEREAVPASALDPAQRHNLPPWLATALEGPCGGSVEALAEALNRPAPLDLRVNPLKTRREAVLAALAEAGLSAEPTPYSPWGIRVQGKPSLSAFPPYREGALEVQDEGSQLLALLVAPRRNDMVVDFCAGAGGKTLALGALMRNTGRLYAFDTSAHRLDALAPRLQRSGLTNVHPMVIAHERDERVARLSAKVDRVLVDAPCSGLGTLRRSPDLKWRQTPETVAELAALQQRILGSAARLLKPGGRLVYATCSLLTEENEAVAQAFSAAHPDFEALDVPALLAAAQVPDAMTLGRQGYLRLWPDRHGTDGFFAAVWQRRR